MNTTTPPIDFVITWVDDTDDDWRRLRDSYRSVPVDPEAVSEIRFRDWGLLRYWFRGVDLFAPWVRKVFLVTENPVPSWLNTLHPKVEVVRHAQFIPAPYLPTFNSRAIELNLHRLPGISEHFVYFNDDMFITAPVTEDHFFYRAKPRAFAISTTLSIGNNFHHAMLNNLEVLNRNFSKQKSFVQSWWNWLSLKYGAAALQNLALLPWKRFTGFHNHHLPLPMLRSTAEHIWQVENETLSQTSHSKFRSLSDVNPFLLVWWNICSGYFAPSSIKHYGKYLVHTEENLDTITSAVSSGRYKMLCINDGDISDVDRARHELLAAFSSLLPEKSSFEID
ncbi:Stealth CR1 domain-containing protein [Microbacterium sp. YY-01]|uniref:Stealth CR1 domain-containing protein n=1 Tax=Microbacterium sp. YY-01 TaxID=3421634 RepID=UPI003D17016F